MDEVGLELRLGKHASDVQFVKCPADLGDSAGADRPGRIDRDGSDAREPEGVLEIPVAVVKHDIPAVADRLQALAQIPFQGVNSLANCLQVVAVGVCAIGVDAGEDRRRCLGNTARI